MTTAMELETDLAWLDQESLLSAIRGHHVGPHPMARRARTLGEIHTQLLADPEQPILLTCRRESIAAIDRWLAPRLPRPHPSAAARADTVGMVIDRIAAAQVRALDELMNRPADHPIVHECWCRLAKLVEDYNDLITAIDRRSRWLPTLTVL
ncbi:DUF4254 domain-containing protein [Nocardia cyriacigeorgica]|uniref:DUF4254 domain-containing protein n=1 Tax=Nocardia cyriacigeorgica TaxID=135487 RepID=UPI0018957667|nr:DUF4254 domain-containing protein [Nocardia cyriacigeorgica]MBF6397845.1 DUF4254 domain-containing protein [Nocardia cyriacigeorgica]MBF6402498.1 DUF4254 domain-containing protein [Nocardia cyriacigeorgica]